MNGSILSVGGIVILAAVVGTPGFGQEQSTSYRSGISKWRKEQEADLKKAEGWLSVAGLFWLTEGETSVGTSASSGVLLPPGSAPAEVGKLTLREGHVDLALNPGVDAKVNGKAVLTTELKVDATGAPDRVTIGALTFMVIQRGKRIGIRLFDQNCKGRKEFKGQKWFGIDAAYRVEAKFVPYDPPKTLTITNVLGDTQPVPSPGYVTFVIRGRECRLEAQDAGSALFFNFRDLTTGKSTYPAGRFLDAPKPKDGVVVIDFNQATNPPCAFTDFATCPLPPQANSLDVEIPAGEKVYHVH